MEKHKSKSVFQCHICSRKFPRDNVLQKHLVTHSEFPQIYKCEICQKEFDNMKGYGKHKLNFHDRENQRKPCEICKMEVLDLQRHMRIHDSKKENTCEICDKTFSNRGNLKIHLLTHEIKTKDFKCKYCSKEFTFLKYMNRHIELVHETADKVTCEICEKQIKPKLLYLHQRQHEEPKFSCEICSKKFFRKGNLKLHQKVHLDSEEIEKFKCDICSKEFSTKCNMNRHKKSHGGEQKIQCSICTSQFSEKSDLQKHFLRLHSDQPRLKFPCETCGKEYLSNFYLKVHRKTHEVREKN